MKVFKKLKDVLFDIEEEEEIPVITKEDKPEEVSPIKEVKMPKEEDDFEDLKPIRFKKEVEEVKEEEPPKKEPFNFPLDDDFEDVPLRSKRDYFDEEFTSRHYLEPEPSRKKEDDFDYSKLSSFEEVKKEEVRNFKPSPVISPVYGILDQNYTKDDVIVKSDANAKKKSPNLDDVRKKAYGTKKEAVKEEIKEAYEDEFAEPLKTLDEILIDKEDEKEEVIKGPVIKEETKENIEVFDDELPDEPYADEVKEVEEPVEEKEEDELESDLFNLIDSMYEEGEEDDD